MLKKLLFAAIMVLALLLRTYNVTNYPPLLWDEAALGYNAYSLLKTGSDEHGQSFPLIFKSFGDYKPGLYIYLSMPFIQTMGLNTFSIRLPSILFGVLICLILYKLTKSKSVLFLSAITPYLIHYSRGAWETNLTTFVTLLSIYLFLQKKPLLSTILLALNLYAYQSGKFVSIIFFMYYLYTYPKQYLKQIPIIILIALPLVYGILFSSNSNRLQVVSLFSYPNNEIKNTLLTNQPIYFLKEFTTRYLNHFSPQFLFTQGDWQSPRHSAPYIGVLLLTYILFLPLGLLNYKKNTTANIMLFWLFTAPLAASLTRDQIQATRSMSLAVPLVYFSGLGLEFLFHRYKKIAFVTVLATLLSLFYYLELYHHHMIKKSPKEWLYGYSEAISKVNSKKYDHVVFSDFYGQPYIFYLFFTKYDPKTYQKQNNYTDIGLDTGVVKKIDNLTFTSPNFTNIKQSNNTLVIFSHDEILRQGLDAKQFNPLGKVGDIATFYSYETN